MWSWIFTLVTSLLIPVIMMGFGAVFLKRPPKGINHVYGYRTAMSMKNEDTWEFAHKYCGKLWYRCGWGMLLISIAVMILLLGRSEEAVGIAGGVMSALQCCILIGSIFPTEIALMRHFDKDGNRK